MQWVQCMVVSAFPSWGTAEVELYAVEVFPVGFGQSPRLNRKGRRRGDEF